MIVLYTILQDNNTLQSYTHPNRSADEYSQIVKQTLRHSKDNGSKIINVLNVGPYFVYYFKQDSFTFILACFSNKRSNKMHNYLRIVADIFYESYEEGKFADKLVKVMEEVNRIQEEKKEEVVFEDEENSLVEGANLLEQKNRISGLVQKRYQKSLRAYFVSALLFLGIVLLAAFYLRGRWGM